MASAAAGFMRTFGIDEPMGCYDDFEAADAFVLWGSNMAEMHPILWSRITDRRLSYPHVKVAVLSTFEHRSFELADIPMVFKPQTRPHHPQRHRQPHHQDQSRQHGLRRQACRLQAGPDRHRLRSATGASAAAKGDRQGQGQRRHRHHVRSVRGVRIGLHAAEGGRRIRRAAQSHRSLGGALRGPQDEGHEPVDHGLQPAHARCLGQQSRLQSAPADGQDLGARQQPVLADRPAVGMRHRPRGRHVLASPARRHGRHQSRASRQDRENLAAARGHDLRQAWLSRRLAEPDAEGRQAQCLLGAGEQQPAGGRQHQSGRSAGLQEPRHLRRRVGCLPDRHHPGCRPRPARRDVGREGRRLRQFGAAHAFLAPARERPGRRPLRSVAIDGVLEALQGRGGLAGRADRQEAGISRQDAVRRALQERPGRQISAPGHRGGIRERRSEALRLLRAEGPVRGVRQRSAAAMGTTSLRSIPIIRREGCAGRSSTARRRAGAFAKATIPTSRRAKGTISTAFPTARRASLPCRTSRLPRAPTPSTRSGSRRDACWSIGIPDR